MADVKEPSEKSRLATIARLVAAQNEQLDKLAAIRLELDHALNGGPGLGARMKYFEGEWGKIWNIRYSGSYRLMTSDRPALKRLVLAYSDGDLIARATAFVRDGDEFFVKARHTFSLLERAMNRYAPMAETFELEGTEATDCKHTPPCRNDVEHTKRKMAEDRGAAF